MDNAVMAWSGGKDSAMALFEVIRKKEYEIDSLLTTVTEGYERISMHGVRIELLEKQAQALNLPLVKVYIPRESDNEIYEERMQETLDAFIERGISNVIFGDIFLEDLREYRENNLKRAGMKGVFPIWERNTAELADEFVSTGFKAIITCVDTEMLAGDFCGRQYDRNFVGQLPEEVDPCGENGEFHSFVYDGPILKENINFKKGEIVLREERFMFCDLLPED